LVAAISEVVEKTKLDRKSMTSTLALLIWWCSFPEWPELSTSRSVIPARAQAHTLPFEVASVKVAQGGILQTTPSRKG
jgi:hypothetical protein